VCGIKTFAVLNSSLNATGLAGLDKLLGFRIVHELGFFLKFYQEQVKAYLPALQQVWCCILGAYLVLAAIHEHENTAIHYAFFLMCHFSPVFFSSPLSIFLHVSPLSLSLFPNILFFSQVSDGLHPVHSTPSNSSRLYSAGLKQMEKLMAPMLKAMLKIGQAQLLRRQLGNVLQFSCRLDGACVGEIIVAGALCNLK